MIAISCEWCGNKFLIYPSRLGVSRFCCLQCSFAWRSQRFSGSGNPHWTKRVEYTCKQCGATFQDMTTKKRRFCSRACYDEWRSKHQIGAANPSWRGGKRVYICKQCGKKILARADKISVFCSRACKGLWSSIHNSKEKPCCVDCGKRLSGYRATRCTQCAGKQRRMESKDYPSEFDDALKDMVRERDGFQCALCGQEYLGSRLHVHHVDYDKDNLGLNNLIALCKSCHGKTNTHRSDWASFFPALMTITLIARKEFR